MKDNKPSAFVLLHEGRTVRFFDLQSGMKLDDSFQGICRFFIGGVVDAIMRTEVNADGYRRWFPVDSNAFRFGM